MAARKENDIIPTMTQVFSNPVKFLSLLPLLPAEAKFARCLAEGIPCEVGNGELPKEGIESGENANVVRGEVVRFFAYGGNPDKHPIRGAVIALQGAWILGESSLIPDCMRIYPYARGPFHIVARFVGSVVMLHAEMRRALL